MDLDYEDIKKNKKRAYYEKNRESILAKVKAHQVKKKKELFVIIQIWKAEGCAKCTEDDMCCLHAHHIDPKLKKGNISRAWSEGWSANKLIKELQKCICLCANCHAKLHAGKIEL